MLISLYFGFCDTTPFIENFNDAAKSDGDASNEAV